MFFGIPPKIAISPRQYWRILHPHHPPTPPELGADLAPTSRLLPGLLFVVGAAGEFFHIDQAGQHGSAAVALALEHQFVDEALAAPAVMHQQIFEFFEAMQMRL